MDEEVKRKLFEYGASALSDVELLSVFFTDKISNGTPLGLGVEVLGKCNNSLGELSQMSVSKLRMVTLSQKRAAFLGAAFELGRRSYAEKALMIDNLRTDTDVLNYFKPLLGDLPYEEFWVVYLGASHRVIDKIKISQGGINHTIVESKLVMKHAISKLAVSIILVHNHPSGVSTPSDEDIDMTAKIKDAAKLFDIKLLDHIIISRGESYSFKGNGLLSL